MPTGKKIENKPREERTIFEKIELLESAMKVAEFFEVNANELIGFTAMLNEDKKNEWNKLANDVIEFQKLPIEQRFEKAGYKLRLESS